MKMKLELVAVPVADTDRAKAFYTEKLAFMPLSEHGATAEEALSCTTGPT